METQHIQIRKTITETTRARKRKKILVIDEDKDSALSTALEQKGYDLIHCDSVQKAWGLVYPHRPQLIVLHLHDTNGPGLSNLQECRALAEDIPIILAAPAKVNQRLIKATQHRATVILVASSTPESVTEALRHLEISAITRSSRPLRAHSRSNF